MSIDVHTVDLMGPLTGVTSSFSRTDRVLMGLNLAIANVAGGSAGASVTTALTGSLSGTYGVFVSCSADVVASVTSKTVSGFNVVLEPRLATETIAAGTFDVLIVG